MNPGTRTITTGIDGSRASLDAADWAAREAERRRLPLRLLHAGTDPPASAPPEAGLPARSTLDHTAIQLAYAHPALHIVARRTATPAVPALIEAAAEAEALALGCRSATGLAGFLVGSVARPVADRAERPVVLVRAGDLPEDERLPVTDDTPPRLAPYLPVVLGLDLECPADDLIAYAFDTAAARPAPLHVVHAWTSPPTGGHAPRVPRAGDTMEREQATCRVLTATLQPWRHKYPETPVSEHVVHGDPVPHLVKASARAGLLVIGRRLSAGTGLGRTARFLIHHVTCPVAVVPHD
jgi:nucleotide-binding universal stress UspA family protein